MAHEGLPLTVEDAGTALRAGEMKAIELTEHLLERADRWDGRLGVFQERFDDQARAAALTADAELAAGRDRGPLHGIPLVLKDIVTCTEQPPTAGSLVPHSLSGHTGDAVSVARLRAAGAVFLGKVKMAEFAIGGPYPATPFGDPLNPWDFGAWTGVSSSGSAAAVASGLALGGLGTDTAGSIRGPSACCGTTGLKPTYGRVPRSGCVPLAYSLDTIGPICRTAADCGLLLTAMAGFDASDPTSATPRLRLPEHLPGSLAGIRIGVDRLEDQSQGWIHPEQPRLLDDAIEVMASAGAQITPVELPFYAEMNAAALVTLLGEGSAYHAAAFRRAWSRYAPSTRRRLGAGAFLTAADYVQAQRARRAGQHAVARLLTQVDLVLTPTSVRPAGPVTSPDVHMGMHAPYWSAVGAPTLSVPIGFTADGLPLAMQISGRLYGEAAVLRAGHAYQAHTDWHLRTPPSLAIDDLPEAPPAAASAGAEQAAAAPGRPGAAGAAPAVRPLLDLAGINASAGDLACFASEFASVRRAAQLVSALSCEQDAEPALAWVPDVPGEGQF